MVDLSQLMYSQPDSCEKCGRNDWEVLGDGRYAEEKHPSSVVFGCIHCRSKFHRTLAYKDGTYVFTQVFEMFRSAEEWAEFHGETDSAPVGNNFCAELKEDARG